MTTDPVTLAREVLETAHEDETVTVCSVPDNKAAALAHAVIDLTAKVARVEALEAALEKVLKLHPRVVVLLADPEFGQMEDEAICGACIVNHEPADWPCPNVTAITTALNGGDQ